MREPPIVTLPVKLAATPVILLTVISGVHDKLNAVVAQETEDPPPRVATPLTINAPSTVKSLPTLKFPLASVTSPTLNALYATNSRVSPLIK